MAFLKVLKNKAYFRRYQVKKRRRLEGKTDYFARRKMVQQDKNKYGTKKYRFVVRFTNRQVICQVAYSTLIGDKIVTAASSKELPAYGIPVGHSNYAAAYATGLLCARRCLKKLELDSIIKGKEVADGEEFHIEEEDTEQRPFKCLLDVGLRRTTIGARMWGSLKGAVDGGLYIPHSTKNFPGSSPAEDKGGEGSYDAEEHKNKILGKHVAEYMEMLQDEDPSKYEAHFSRFIKEGLEGEKLGDMYASAHKKIRDDPSKKPKAKKNLTHTRKGNSINASDGTHHIRSIKLTLAQRREKVQAKITAAQQRMLAEAEAD